MSNPENRLYGKNHPMFGKHHTEENKQKMSITRKGKSMSEETKSKMSVAHMSKPLSKEHRRKISVAHCKNEYEIKQPNGEVENIKNMNMYCEKNNLDYSSMYKVSRGTLKHYRGYKVKIK